MKSVMSKQRSCHWTTGDSCELGRTSIRQEESERLATTVNDWSSVAAMPCSAIGGQESNPDTSCCRVAARRKLIEGYGPDFRAEQSTPHPRRSRPPARSLRCASRRWRSRSRPAAAVRRLPASRSGCHLSPPTRHAIANLKTAQGFFRGSMTQWQPYSTDAAGQAIRQ